MNKKAKLITLGLLVFFSTNMTNVLKAQTTVKEMTDKFFQTYEQSPLQAIDYIFSTNKWMMERSKDQIDNVKNRLTSVLGLIGGYYGYEKITEKKVGESYILLSYLIKYDRQPLRFTFIFYKPNDKWQLQNFQYDDSLGDELQESAKVFRLKEN